MPLPKVKIIEDNTRAEMIAAYKKQFCDEAQKQAKKEANDKAKTAEGQALLARVKNEIREELRAEVEANHLPTLRKQAKEELLAQMAQLE
ncbi:hypothetical protein OEA41_006748 [Lepraria neglecta]|uniref:Uncharacterized protein n=1 Tax=Lepraria neglecta TaxID=209136 RepID=A0AAD9Z8J9_9LECA|nr:hypothetical protein OEA41_006748 [Lepraria neglecta]